MRVQFIDIARGLCILLVVWGHNPTFVATEANSLLSLLRMPLMFFIAGSFLSPTHDWRRLAIEKADALLKPFFVMAVLQAPFRVALSGASPEGYVLAMLSGSGNYLPWMYVFWFITHLWWVLLLGNALVVILRFKRWGLAWQTMTLAGMLWAGVAGLSLFWRPNQPILNSTVMWQGLPFSLDLLPITTAFFMLGVVCRPALDQWRFTWGALLMSGAVLVGCQWPQVNTIQLLDRHYGHVIWSTVSAVAGIGLVMTAAAGLVNRRGLAPLLSLCGRNSIFILLFHSQLQTIGNRLWLQLIPGSAVLSAWLGWITCIGMCLLLAEFIRRHHWLAVWWLPVKAVKRPQLRSAPQLT